jgi:predicted molibdopterin-dependent oxidoreductase YjgC
MLLAEHPACCLICPENNACDECMVTLRKAGVTTGCRSCPNDRQCEIQDLVQSIGLTRVDYPIRYRMLKPIHSDPFIDRDYNLCVLCGRCVRICQFGHFSSAVTFMDRGSDIVVATSGGRSLLEAGCRFCGSCVDICPTGALSEKTRKWMGKPDQVTSTTCPFCSLACSMEIEAKNGIAIGSRPSPTGTGPLCLLGHFSLPEMLNHPNRLKSPARRTGKDRLKTSWEDSLDRTAQIITACPPGSSRMVVSASSSNEDLFAAYKFSRQILKSEPIISARAVYGDGFDAMIALLRQSSPLDELRHARTVLCLGVDDRYTASVVEAHIYQAKIRGAHVISFSHRPHSLAEFADLWLKPDPGKELDILQQAGEFLTGKNAGEPGKSTIVLGPSFLSQPALRRKIAAVLDLIQSTQSKVIVLPPEGNLMGSVLMGAGGDEDEQDLPGMHPDPVGVIHPNPRVYYLIGDILPAARGPLDTIIYQNFMAPPDGLEADIILPEAAFAESAATTVDYAGRVQPVKQAIPPPGEALPTWQILCQLAKKMGASGFDYSCVEEIQAEISRILPGFSTGTILDRSGLPHGSISRAPSGYEEVEGEAGDETGRPGKAIHGDYPAAGGPTYMGFPIADWVEGLRSIYPQAAPPFTALDGNSSIQPQKTIIPG